MLHKTSGIILHTVKYAESGLIVKAYTQEYGLQSYIISGIRNKKSGNKTSLFQPLTLVDIVSTGNPKSSLQRISEISISQPYTHIPYDIIKSTLTIFLNEVLLKTLKEAQPDEELFQFLKNSFLILDIYPANCANFHLSFMVQYSRFLGFSPQGKFSENTPFVDLKEGSFTGKRPGHSYYLDSKQAEILSRVVISDYETVKDIKIDNLERRQLLNGLLLLYQLHIDGFGALKSPAILEEVMG
jgi:DNA repair protein RecO (recombination protein O)